MSQYRSYCDMDADNFALAVENESVDRRGEPPAAMGIPFPISLEPKLPASLEKVKEELFRSSGQEGRNSELAEQLFSEVMDPTVTPTLQVAKYLVSMREQLSADDKPTTASESRPIISKIVSELDRPILPVDETDLAERDKAWQQVLAQDMGHNRVEVKLPEQDSDEEIEGGFSDWLSDLRDCATRIRSQPPSIFTREDKPVHCRSAGPSLPVRDELTGQLPLRGKMVNVAPQSPVASFPRELYTGPSKRVARMRTKLIARKEASTGQEFEELNRDFVAIDVSQTASLPAPGSQAAAYLAEQVREYGPRYGVRLADVSESDEDVPALLEMTGMDDFDID